LTALGSDLRGDMDALRRDLRAEMSALGRELRAETKDLPGQLRSELRTIVVSNAALAICVGGLVLAATQLA
jgi:hypothetical protein